MSESLPPVEPSKNKVDRPLMIIGGVILFFCLCCCALIVAQYLLERSGITLV